MLLDYSTCPFRARLVRRRDEHLLCKAKTASPDYFEQTGALTRARPDTMSGLSPARRRETGIDQESHHGL
jgi:hypothetical protein